MDALTEEDDDADEPGIAVDSWVKRINERYSVFFEDMYEDDIEARKKNAEHVVLKDIAPVEEVAEQTKMLEDLIKKVESLGNQLESVLKTLDKFEERLGPLELFGKEAHKGLKKGSKKK